MHNTEGNLGHYLQFLDCEMACLPAKEEKLTAVPKAQPCIWKEEYKTELFLL